MAWVATAVVGGSVLGGLISSNGAQNAAQTQADAANNASGVQKYIYDTTRADQAPWVAAGTNALGQMQNFAAPSSFSFTAQDFNNNQDPGYAFRMSEGIKALDRSAASRGGLLSGAQLKGITNYAQGAASQEYQNAYGRALTGYNANQGAQNTQFNRLASLAGVGQTANNQVANAGQNYASGVSSNIIGAGNAQAAGQVGSANAINNGISQGISQYQNNNMMSKLFSTSSATPSYANNYVNTYGAPG